MDKMLQAVEKVNAISNPVAPLVPGTKTQGTAAANVNADGAAVNINLNINFLNFGKKGESLENKGE